MASVPQGSPGDGDEAPGSIASPSSPGFPLRQLVPRNLGASETVISTTVYNFSSDV